MRSRDGRGAHIPKTRYRYFLSEEEGPSQMTPGGREERLRETDLGLNRVSGGFNLTLNPLIDCYLSAAPRLTNQFRSHTIFCCSARVCLLALERMAETGQLERSTPALRLSTPSSITSRALGPMRANDANCRRFAFSISSRSSLTLTTCDAPKSRD
jgi:hypothetical protein